MTEGLDWNKGFIEMNDRFLPTFWPWPLVIGSCSLALGPWSEVGPCMAPLEMQCAQFFHVRASLARIYNYTPVWGPCCYPPLVGPYVEDISDERASEILLISQWSCSKAPPTGHLGWLHAILPCEGFACRDEGSTTTHEPAGMEGGRACMGSGWDLRACCMQFFHVRVSRTRVRRQQLQQSDDGRIGLEQMIH